MIVIKSVITINHVLASAAIPINYPYIEISEKISEKKYWDGGILSNTPLRELISSHTISIQKIMNRTGRYKRV